MWRMWNIFEHLNNFKWEKKKKLARAKKKKVTQFLVITYIRLEPRRVFWKVERKNLSTILHIINHRANLSFIKTSDDTISVTIIFWQSFVCRLIQKFINHVTHRDNYEQNSFKIPDVSH